MGRPREDAGGVKPERQGYQWAQTEQGTCTGHAARAPDFGLVPGNGTSETMGLLSLTLSSKGGEGTGQDATKLEGRYN